MIILINGSINSGKSTVASHLRAQLDHAAHVEVDDLHNFIGHVSLAEAIPINLENAVCVTRNFVRHDFHVIITSPLGIDDHAYLIDQLTPCHVPIYTFTLSPDLSVAVTNRGTRELSAYEVRRIHEQYADGRHHPPFGETIDNTALSPAETATHLLRRIASSA
jgi:hypothetical protein